MESTTQVASKKICSVNSMRLRKSSTNPTVCVCKEKLLSEKYMSDLSVEISSTDSVVKLTTDKIIPTDSEIEVDLDGKALDDIEVLTETNV